MKLIVPIFQVNAGNRVKVRFNLWIEENGDVALSMWRVKLLTIIGETGSINAAADQLNIPYRTAWLKIHEMEQRLGTRLLETHTGGKHGGGAQLTPEARDLIVKFEKLKADLEPFVEASFEKIFNK